MIIDTISNSQAFFKRELKWLDSIVKMNVLVRGDVREARLCDMEA